MNNQTENIISDSSENDMQHISSHKEAMNECFWSIESLEKKCQGLLKHLETHGISVPISYRAHIQTYSQLAKVMYNNYFGTLEKKQKNLFYTIHPNLFGLMENLQNIQLELQDKLLNNEADRDVPQKRVDLENLIGEIHPNEIKHLEYNENVETDVSVESEMPSEESLFGPTLHEIKRIFETAKEEYQEIPEIINTTAVASFDKNMCFSIKEVETILENFSLDEAFENIHRQRIESSLKLQGCTTIDDRVESLRNVESIMRSFVENMNWFQNSENKEKYLQEDYDKFKKQFLDMIASDMSLPKSLTLQELPLFLEQRTNKMYRSVMLKKFGFINDIIQKVDFCAEYFQGSSLNEGSILLMHKDIPVTAQYASNKQIEDIAFQYKRMEIVPVIDAVKFLKDAGYEYRFSFKIKPALLAKLDRNEANDMFIHQDYLK